MFSVGDKVKIDMKWLENVYDQTFPGIAKVAEPFQNEILNIERIEFKSKSVPRVRYNVILKEKEINRSLRTAISDAGFKIDIHAETWGSLWFIPIKNSCFIIDVIE